MKNLTLTLSGIKLSVDYEYSYDPGVYTYSNGDPGYPPTEEIIITKITTSDDILALLNEYTSEDIISKIEEVISKFERNG